MRTARVSGRTAFWAVLAGVAVVLLALAAASAANYASIVVAHATVHVVPRFAVALNGTDAEGKLTANGTVTVTASVEVRNPSSRTLRWHLIAYGGWIEDWPAADGLNASRRQFDDRLETPNGTRYFFRAFTVSREVASDAVPPAGNATRTFAFVLTSALDPARFAVVRNITDYGVVRNGSATTVPWNHWVRVQLTIDGVPEPASAAAPEHLRNLRRIDLDVGINLARP